MPVPKRNGKNSVPSTPTQKSQTSLSETPAALAARIAAVPRRHDNDNPLWTGPCGKGDLGGVTQSMLARFFGCRERFRLKYILGLEPYDKWNHKLEYGNMWHVCEEAHAKGERWDTFHRYVEKLFTKYPMDRADIEKWANVCRVQFPEYVRHWKSEPDVLCRQPLLQEQVFDVPYILPSGRIVRLRGKWDSVDLITDDVTGPNGGIYLQENKTKGDIDQLQIERQLRFDLQTMMYLIALHEKPSCDLPRKNHYRHGGGKGVKVGEYPIMGVRYNVIRRPLSGRKGNIKPHAAKSTKTKYIPAESTEHFYERLRRDYIAKEPGYWFFRVRSEVIHRDIQVFKDTCLNPLLEHLCWWYDMITRTINKPVNCDFIDGKWGYLLESINYRTPFGIYNPLMEDGATEYDAFLATGSETGLRRVNTLFPELQ